MIRLAAYVLTVALGQTACATDRAPSGLAATLHETIYEPVGVPAASAKTMRLRYLAPAIADEARTGFSVIEADFVWFCERDGVKATTQVAPMVERIIVSIASEEVEFGETAPNVVQYFDAFRVEDQRCIWEGL